MRTPDNLDGCIPLILLNLYAEVFAVYEFFP